MLTLFLLFSLRRQILNRFFKLAIQSNKTLFLEKRVFFPFAFFIKITVFENKHLTYCALCYN